MRRITYKPIGKVQSPFKETKEVFIQPKSAKRIRGKVVVE